VTAHPSQSSLRYVLSATLLVALLWHPGARAHRDHGVWTEVLWAETHFEITHQLHLADALPLLEALDANAAIDSLEGQALIALHVAETFSLEAESAKGSIETIGAEIDDDFLFIYQEWYGQKPSGEPGFSLTALDLIYGATRATIHYQVDGRNDLLHLNPGAPEAHSSSTSSHRAR
jgi:hypothetical protein